MSTNGVISDLAELSWALITLTGYRLIAALIYFVEILILVVVVWKLSQFIGISFSVEVPIEAIFIGVVSGGFVSVTSAARSD